MTTVDKALQTRKRNFDMLWEACESAAALQRASGMRRATLTSLRDGDSALTTSLARTLEEGLELPSGWLDVSRAELPETVRAQVQARAVRPGREGDTPELAQRRVGNVEWLVGIGRGAKGEFCRRAGWIAQEFSLMKTRGLSEQKARALERQLQLPTGWLDEDHDHGVSLPQEFEERLQAAASAAGVPVARADRRERAASREASALALVQSPVTRALIEKLLDVGAKGLLPESRAVELLSEIVALDRPA